MNAEPEEMPTPQDEHVIKLARILYATLDERGAAGRDLDHEPSNVKHWWAGKAYLVLQALSREFLGGGNGVALVPDAPPIKTH
jgi:hypothetical protein